MENCNEDTKNGPNEIGLLPISSLKFETLRPNFVMNKEFFAQC